jgi:hypothetical protein
MIVRKEAAFYGVTVAAHRFPLLQGNALRTAITQTWFADIAFADRVLDIVHEHKRFTILSGAGRKWKSPAVRPGCVVS